MVATAFAACGVEDDEQHRARPVPLTTLPERAHVWRGGTLATLGDNDLECGGPLTEVVEGRREELRCAVRQLPRSRPCHVLKERGVPHS